MKKILWFNWDNKRPHPFFIPSEKGWFDLVSHSAAQTKLEKDENAHAIVIDANEKINDKTLSYYPNLKFIITQTSRTDHIGIKKPGIEVLRIGGHYCAKTIANKCKYYAKRLAKESKKQIGTIGIIGFGVIGKEIAAAFNRTKNGKKKNKPKEILFSDPFEFDSFQEIAKKSTIAEIEKKADLIILICPVNTRSVGTINQLQTFRKKPIIFNLSGPSTASLRALDLLMQKREISGYWYDFGPKKLIGNKFVLTPHNAWDSIESRNLRFKQTIELIEKKLGVVIRYG